MCRCTGYMNIVKAYQQAARTMHGDPMPVAVGEED
jgi:xanthine dehydrogenase iron-sulfur cluster and FAD-binding subunit A